MFYLYGTLKKSGSVGRWETNQFIGMALREMKADQKYSKVVGIEGGGGYINETEGAIMGWGYINEINEFQVQLSPRSKKKVHSGSLHFNSYRFLWSLPTYLVLTILNIFF